MKPIIAVLACAGFAISSAHASEPGRPLDCSDWVFLEPGLTCSPFLAFNAVDPHSSGLLKGVQREVDNMGSLYSIRAVSPGCNDWDVCDRRTELVRLDPEGQHVVAYIEDRPSVQGSNRDHIRPVGSYCAGPDNCPSWAGIRLNEALSFDPIRGRLLISLRSYCAAFNSSGCMVDNYDGWWIAAISGFTTLFEIQQTYTPAPPAISFRVPVRPENLASVSRFDTYWGRVSDLPNYTQAQPLACNYPSDHQPQAGEYLTVAETSPRPATGQANYIVTAVSYGAEGRYGRQRTGSSLTGRNPALLPSCP